MGRTLASREGELRRASGLVFSLAIFAVGIEGTLAVADERAACYQAAEDAAITACGKLISSGTLEGADLANAYRSLGRALQNKKQHDSAINAFDKAIQADPKDAAVFNLRGNSYQSLGRYDRAVQDYLRAIQLDPKFAAAFYNLGLAYSSGRDFQHALAAYDHAIELNPKDVSAFNNPVTSTR